MTTKEGARKAAKTNKAKYGDDFHKIIGTKGGYTKPTKPRGFAARPELASEAGRKGGSVPRVKKVEAQNELKKPK